MRLSEWRIHPNTSDRIHKLSWGMVFLVMALLFSAAPAVAAPTSCQLSYQVEGWSIFYKVSRGTGRITCEDGQSADVTIVAHGGGFTAGIHKVEEGSGRFSSTERVEDLIRTYFVSGAHAGAGKSVEARIMFGGSKSLSVAGKGSGINLGFSLGGFTIRKR